MGRRKTALQDLSDRELVLRFRSTKSPVIRKRIRTLIFGRYFEDTEKMLEDMLRRSGGRYGPAMVDYNELFDAYHERTFAPTAFQRIAMAFDPLRCPSDEAFRAWFLERVIRNRLRDVLKKRNKRSGLPRREDNAVELRRTHSLGDEQDPPDPGALPGTGLHEEQHPDALEELLHRAMRRIHPAHATVLGVLFLSGRTGSPRLPLPAPREEGLEEACAMALRLARHERDVLAVFEDQTREAEGLRERLGALLQAIRLAEVRMAWLSSQMDAEGCSESRFRLAAMRAERERFKTIEAKLDTLGRQILRGRGASVGRLQVEIVEWRYAEGLKRLQKLRRRRTKALLRLERCQATVHARVARAVDVAPAQLRRAGSRSIRVLRRTMREMEPRLYA